MTRTEFSGADVVAALEALEFTREGPQTGHGVLTYREPETGEVRVVTVPLQDRLAPSVLRNVADQAGATVDFEAFRERISAVLDDRDAGGTDGGTA